MNKTLFVTFVAIIISLNVSSKEKSSPDFTVENSIKTNSVKGVVFDKLTNESLAGVTITANGQKVYTDLDGNFTISNLCNGKCLIKISLISYQEQTVEVDLQDSKTVQVKLSQH